MPTSSWQRTEYIRNRTLATYHRNNPGKPEGGNRPLDYDTLLNRIVGQTLQECCGNSIASAFASIQEFETGAYTITIPTGYTTATVEVWGAGGGAGSDVNDTAVNNTRRRGNGAYLTGTLAVVLGDILTIQVGGGGDGGQINSSGVLGGSGGGGQGSAGDSTRYAGGGGGGYSSISKNTTPCVIAAGGGGGGGEDVQTRTKRGGNGGSRNPTGSPLVADGEDGGNDGSRGRGGSTSGGAPGNLISGSGTAGSSGQGGNGGGNFAGGGGGGYFGGGGGYSNIGEGQGGGGGGSSYIDTALVNSPIFAVTPAGPYGHGGTTAGANGEPGYVRIVFS